MILIETVFPDALFATLGGTAAAKIYLNDQTATVFPATGSGIDLSADISSTGGIAVGDLNNDGAPDIVCGYLSETNKFYLNDGTGGFDTGTLLPFGDLGTCSIGLADLDGDGSLDIISCNQPTQNSLYLNNGNGVFNNRVSITADADSTSSIELIDVDADGDIDFLAGNQNQPDRLYLNNGTRRPFDGVRGINLTTNVLNTFELASGDIGGDGDPDFVILSQDPAPSYIVRNPRSENPFADTTSNLLGPSATGRYAVTADMDRDGDLDILVANTGGVRNFYYAGNGDGTFAPAIAITADTQGSESLVVGDTDNDGDLDLIVLNAGQGNRTYFNDGVGTPFPNNSGSGFSDGRTDNSRDGKLVDLDQDGDIDLVIANGSNQLNLWYENAGNGLVANVNAVTLDTDSSHSITFGDLNQDGLPDIVVGNNFSANKYYLNQGTANPFPSTYSGVPIGSENEATEGIELADVDGDGDLDVICANNGQRNRVYLSNGGPTPFSAATPGIALTAFSDNTIDLKLGDMDADGDLDIIEGNRFARQRIVLNNGTTTPFADQNSYTITAEADETFGIALGDFDGDGDLDIAAAQNLTKNKIYPNQILDASTRFFTANRSNLIENMNNHPGVLVHADFNNDGHLDFFSASSNSPSTVSLGNGNNTFAAPVPVHIDRNTRAAVTGDMNGDGLLDLIVGNETQRNIVYLNDGSGDPFDSATILNVGSEVENTTALAISDIDQDGDLDLLVGNDQQPNRYYENDGSGNPFNTIAPVTLSGASDQVTTLNIADLNRDSRPDVIMGISGSANRVYLHDGNGFPFNNPATALTANIADTRSIATGDLNKDGFIDVIVGNDGVNRFLLNDGVGDPFDTTPVRAISGANFKTSTIALKDVNRDGWLDVIDGNTDGPIIANLHDGQGNPFDSDSNSQTLARGFTNTLAMALADFDRDGQLDLLLGNNQSTVLYHNTPVDLVANTVGSRTINQGSEDITMLTLNPADVIPPNTSIDYFLSNNGGASYFQVQPGVATTLPTTGNAVAWKATLNTKSTALTPIIQQIQILGSAIPEVFFTNTLFSASEDSGPVQLSIGISQPAPGPVTVDIIFTNNSAIAGTDYNGSTSSLTWTNGESGVKSVSVPLIDDGIYEGTETFFAALSNPVNAMLSATQSIAVVEILDDSDIGYGGLQVRLTPDAAPLQGARWRLFQHSNTNWYHTDDIVSPLPQGRYQLEFSQVPSLLTPTNISVTVRFDETNQTTIAYEIKELALVPNSDFYIDRKELTIAEYQRFADATARTIPAQTFNAPELPVGRITWDDAQAYAAWAGKQLPTESQWLIAARGGDATAIYPWGQSASTTNGNFGQSIMSTTEAGSYLPNGFGLYDLGGNVWEWTADTFDETSRIIHGGSWVSGEASTRLANYNFQEAFAAFGDLGVRFITPYQEGADVDNDHLPDEWEVIHFGHWRDVHPANDYDGDGFTELQEFSRNTDPTRIDPPLFISNQIRTPSTGEFLITWQSETGRIYALQRSSTIAPPAWTTVRSNIHGEGNQTTSPISPTAFQTYYRVIEE